MTQFFIILTHIIGIRPANEKNKCVVNTERLQEVLGAEIMTQAAMNKPELNALKSMLQVVAKEEILFDECKLGNESGREWLARLVSHVLTSFSTHQASTMVQALSPLAAVDLLMLETFLPDIVTWICSIPVPPILQHAFSVLLVEALKASDKQQRPHKLIACLLDGINNSVEKGCQNVNVLVSDAFIDQIKLSCSTLHSKHYASLFGTLLFHLEKCVAVLDKSIHEAGNCFSVTCWVI